MSKSSMRIILLLIMSFISFQANSEKNSVFKSLYSSGAKNVVLVNKGTTKIELSKYGNKTCSNKAFCLIWYFEEPNKAKIGVKRAKAGNWFDPIPGLIAIYSKNKIVNKIICHEPKGTC